MSPALAYAMPYDETLLYDRPMRCDQKALANLLAQQWKRISREQIERTRYTKHPLARLIEQEYDIHHAVAEN